MDWHRCQRWTRLGLSCPFRRQEGHKDDDDQGEPEPVPVAPPVPKLAPPAKREARAEVKGDIIRQAEEIVRTVPQPAPVPDPFPEPVLDPTRPNVLTRPAKDRTIQNLPPPPPRPAKLPTPEPSKTPVFRKAAALALQRVYQNVPAAPPVRTKAKPAPVPVPVPVRQFNTLPDPVGQFRAEMVEEAVAQEFAQMPAPAPKSSGFHLTRKQIAGGVAAVAGGTAAVLIGTGGRGGGVGKFIVNSAARLAALMGQ